MSSAAPMTKGYVGIAPERVGVVKFYCATFSDTPDLTGDIIDPHAFDADVAARKKLGIRLPVLWAHDDSDAFSAIGYVEPDDIVIDDHGVLVTAVLDLTNETAERVYKHCKQGIISQASFRYQVKPGGERRITKGPNRGANLLTGISLEEATLCLFGANPQTTIEEVKHANIADAHRKTMLAEIDFVTRVTDASREDRLLAEIEFYGAKAAARNANRCPACFTSLPKFKTEPVGYGYKHVLCKCGTMLFDEDDTNGLTEKQLQMEAARIHGLKSREMTPEDVFQEWVDSLPAETPAQKAARERRKRLAAVEALEADIKRQADVDAFLASVDLTLKEIQS